jgi:hypothetical protein
MTANSEAYDAIDEPVDGIDPRVLAWSARWAVSLATLAAEGFMVYERDGFGELRFVGIDPDSDTLDASGSLGRLRAIEALLSRRGLAGLGFATVAPTTTPIRAFFGVDLNKHGHSVTWSTKIGSAPW